MDYQPKHRAEPESERFMREWHERRQSINVPKYKPFERAFCQEFSDLMDGFVIHAEACPNYQDTAVSGSDCINLVHRAYWPHGLSGVR